VTVVLIPLNDGPNTGYDALGSAEASVQIQRLTKTEHITIDPRQHRRRSFTASRDMVEPS
jgi:hypothetical protein